MPTKTTEACEASDAQVSKNETAVSVRDRKSKFYEWYQKDGFMAYVDSRDLSHTADNLFDWLNRMPQDHLAFLADHIFWKLDGARQTESIPRVIIDFTGGTDNGAWADTDIEIMVVDSEDGYPNKKLDDGRN